MSKLLYPELSYEIVGVMFTVYNALGFGYQEKYYKRAIEKEFELARLSYKREGKVLLKYKGHLIGRYFVDFIVEGKIVVEVKVAEDFYKKDVNQLLAYLKATGLKLGI